MAKLAPHRNIKATMKDNVLTLEVCLDPAKVEVVDSKSGKSDVYATTGGNVPIGNTGFTMGLNVYQKKGSTQQATITV